MIYLRDATSAARWFGDVPRTWSIERLKHLISSASSGVSVNASDQPSDAQCYGVLKTGAVLGGEFFPEENKTVWEAEVHRLSCPVTADSVIMSRMNTPSLVGESGYVKIDFPRLFLPDRLWKLNFDKNRVITPFLAFVLSSSGARQALSSVATGTSASMKNLSIEEMGNLPVPLPPIHEQKTIAAFLRGEVSRLNNLVADKQCILGLLEEKRVTHIARFVTRGLSPNARMKPSGQKWLGAIPAHWQVMPIKYLAAIGNGSTPLVDNEDYWDSDGYPWLNSSVVNAMYVDEPSRYVTAQALKECHLPLLVPPAVLVGITGQGKTRGMASILKIEATINQHLAFIKPRDGRLSADYLRHLLGCAYSFLRNDSDGVGSTKGAITCEQLANMRIPLPPSSEQSDICSQVEKGLDASAKLIGNIVNSVDLLKERRAALITAAVTGQIPLEAMPP